MCDFCTFEYDLAESKKRKVPLTTDWDIDLDRVVSKLEINSLININVQEIACSIVAGFNVEAIDYISVYSHEDFISLILEDRNKSARFIDYFIRCDYTTNGPFVKVEMIIDFLNSEYNHEENEDQYMVDADYVAIISFD